MRGKELTLSTSNGQGSFAARDVAKVQLLMVNLFLVCISTVGHVGQMAIAEEERDKVNKGERWEAANTLCSLFLACGC